MVDYESPQATGGYDEMPDAQAPNVSFLLTLLTMLDFTQPGQVGKEDWERGIAALHAPGLSWEVSWQMLLRRFDLDNNGSIDFGEMHGLAPLDPRLASVLRVMTQTIVRLSERINGAYAGINETKMKMLKGTINQWKEKSLALTFRAWKEDIIKTQEWRKKVLGNFKYAPCRKCIHAIRKMITSRKGAMVKAANMMAGAEIRLKQMTINAWRESHFANQERKNKKLMMFFMGREEWWRMHVIETWRRWTFHERGIRRFLVRWMFMGMAKTFTAWQRHVRQAVEERNLGLAKGMAMLSGGTRYKCFMAWANEARTQREERDEVLRKALLKNGALMEVKVVRAWFDWRTERLKNKHKCLWKISPAGAAFRGWLALIDAKRRREFLEWALGPDLSVITGKLKAATKNISEELGGQIESVRESVTSLHAKVRQEAAVERKATKEAIDRKMDAFEADQKLLELDKTRQEVETIREQLGAQAEVQREMSMETERASMELAQQLQTLSTDVETRVSAAQQDLFARAGAEEKKLNVVTEELTSLKSTKANHEELLHLVQKLQHRPKPGRPIGVQQLLAVPYPMPPGNAKTSGPRRGQQRPSTAAATTHQAMVSAEMREVPTNLPLGPEDDPNSFHPFLATSEQILVRPLPADAIPDGMQTLNGEFGRYGGSASGSGLPRGLVPPSSHAAALSARASPTVNAILANRRPTSARNATGPAAQLGMFNNRTERLERSLDATRGARMEAGEAEAEMPPMM